MGFETLKEVPYDEYKIDGEVVFPPSEPHRSVKLMALTF